MLATANCLRTAHNGDRALGHIVTGGPVVNECESCIEGPRPIAALPSRGDPAEHASNIGERLRAVGVVHALRPRLWTITAAVLVIASLTATSPTMAASTRSSNPLRPLQWGKELEIWGPDGLFTSLSCAARGYCTAVGYWLLPMDAGSSDGFVLDEANGKWGRPFAVHGLDANHRADSNVLSVSCSAKGTCVAGGAAGAPFSDGTYGFVVEEKRGVWGNARPEPGPGSLALGTHGGRDSSVESASCAAPGDCTAVGQYENAAGQVQGFVVDERNGVWRSAQDVSGLATLSGGATAGVDTVSCTGVGDCSAAGTWYDGALRGFVVNESHGTWGSAKAITGISLDAGDGPSPIELSCAAPGDCAATGTDGPPGSQGGFVIDESRGTWGAAAPIPGLASLNTGHNAVLGAISCWAVGSCDAVGMYQKQVQTGSPPEPGFLVEEGAGIWHGARAIPGLVTLTGDGFALPTTISCDATGDCAAGGIYNGGGNFVVDKVRGVWHDAKGVGGAGGQNTEISCIPGDHCVVATDFHNSAATGEVASGPVLPRRG